MNRNKMEVEIEREGDIRIIRVKGAFDMSTTPVMKDICARATSGKGVRAVILDFAAAEKVDSAPFACMIDFIKEHASRDITIGVINLSGIGANMLGILKLEGTIKVFDDESTAISELKRGK